MFRLPLEMAKCKAESKSTPEERDGLRLAISKEELAERSWQYQKMEVRGFHRLLAFFVAFLWISAIVLPLWLYECDIRGPIQGTAVHTTQSRRKTLLHVHIVERHDAPITCASSVVIIMADRCSTSQKQRLSERLV